MPPGVAAFLLRERAISTPLRLSNREARWLLLSAQGLATIPTGPLDLARIIEQLGFVQLDTIQVVTRAHHHILWSRNQHYREPMLDRFMAQDRGVFEHFTHDASVIPMAFYPMWRRQFERLEKKVRSWGWHRARGQGVSLASVKKRIQSEGPLSTRDFSSQPRGDREMWSRPPHKLILDYLWYAGDLTTSHRVNFTKFYDLAERVIPAEYRGLQIEDQDQVRWLCENALERLVLATAGDLQRFWDALDSAEAQSWIADSRDSLIPVEVIDADRSCRTVFAAPDLEQRLVTLAPPTSRLRILNPFDPLLRDRKRLRQLFGFDYTVEMFVPAARRRCGYYVYPLLEGDRFVGRLEVKAERKQGQLQVKRLWSEPGVRWTSKRAQKLDAELKRLAQLVSVPEVRWICNRSPEIGEPPPAA